MPVRNLKDGTLKIADASGTGGANVITLDLEEGDLSWTEATPIDVIRDRGVLDHTRKGIEEPVRVSWTSKYQSLSTHATTTEYDALTQTGGASGWTSDEDNSDVYAVILEFTLTDPAGGASEVLTFARFACEEKTFNEGSPNSTMAISGIAMITAPAIS